MTGILYLAVINQFLNQEHDVEKTFMNLIKENSSEVRRIPLPVHFSDEQVEKDLRKLYTVEAGKVELKNVSEMTRMHVSEMIRGLMYCSDSTVAEHFRMLNVYLIRALDHTIETRKHRTFLVTMFEKA